ncbi:transcriptional regulator [Paenibacillus alginolyticus]|uniref:helix-turn-helix domain-containing protein n=1 Tax=Paenibacillus alginolyticus TaxID=59839 RepID=UPI00041F1844|nr:transcriptional regulator [Paenibacillus alginolyticus]MCY9666713.1 transcriptional regulator [Paenibacillus alginolyticus]
MENLKGFGDFVKTLRKKRGYTLKQLAELSGVSDAQISRIENGSRGVPKLENLKNLAKALDVPADSLLEKAGLIKKSDSNFEDAAMLAGALDTRFYENDQEVEKYFAHEITKFADMESNKFKEIFLQPLWLTAQNYGMHITTENFTPRTYIDGVLSLDSRRRMLLNLELGRLEYDWERETSLLNLEDLLKLPNIGYGNKKLSQNDCQRVESMLQLLFKGEG